MLFSNIRKLKQKKQEDKDAALGNRRRSSDQRRSSERDGHNLLYYKDEQDVGDDVVDETTMFDPTGLTVGVSENYDDEKMTIKQRVMACISFSFHFIIVMGLLFGGALGFVYFEDPESLMEVAQGNDTSGNRTIESNTVEELTLLGEAAKNMFWMKMQNRYNLSLESNEKEEMLESFRNFISEETERNDKIAYKKLHTKKFAMLKWLYFVTIATTTIGYGDVSPKTDNGKIFYIFFSVVGVILMMSLMARCGSVVSYANTGFFNLIKKYLCGGKMDDDGEDDGEDDKEPFISSELLTSISILLIFGGYLYAGIWYGQYVAKMEGWSYIDTIYFWIVTFTTVGFGDITQPLEKEVENIYIYCIYRIFGLAFLAAIIDALTAYSEVVRIQAKKRMDKQRKKLMEKQAQLMNKANEKMKANLPSINI